MNKEVNNSKENLKDINTDGLINGKSIEEVLEDKKWWIESFPVFGSDFKESYKTCTLCVKWNDKIYRCELDGMKLTPIYNKDCFAETDKKIILTELKWAIETIKNEITRSYERK